MIGQKISIEDQTPKNGTETHAFSNEKPCEGQIISNNSEAATIHSKNTTTIRNMAALKKESENN